MAIVEIEIIGIDLPWIICGLQFTVKELDSFHGEMHTLLFLSPPCLGETRARDFKLTVIVVAGVV